MHIARGPSRTALHLQSLPPEVRQYVAELEYELGRTQRRNCLLRKNIRSMQAKLEIANAKSDRDNLAVRVTELARIARVSLTEDEVKRIVTDTFWEAQQTAARVAV